MNQFDTHSDLPVRAVLPVLLDALRTTGRAVLAASPGAGKTTLVPPALLADLPEGKIILLEPRRVAARAAARRIAALLGEEVGARVGYIVRGESCRSPRTRLLVVTGGVLLRMLQDDPELAGVNTVIFDEFHERSLENDLDLALTLDIRRNLRPELRLLVMSATLEIEAVSRLLDNAPVIDAPGRCFPVELRWSNDSVDRFHPAPAVARAVLGLYRETAGDLLAFLPGMKEIQETAGLLRPVLPADALLLPLHGALTVREQDAALAPPPAGKRKIVLSTNVAESSLTIDGITAVVDSGLEKRLRYSPSAGISFLETCRISKASASQRSGRAGRTCPGIALRLWSELDHRALPERTTPEILDCDLAGFALELAAWGTAPEMLAWIDAPPAAGLAAARRMLVELGALDSDFRLTPHGRRLAELPLHPRLGMMLLCAAELDLAPLAAELAALLEERDPFRNFTSADLAERLRAMRRRSADYRVQRAIRDQLLAILGIRYREQDPEHAGIPIAFAYPEWIGRARGRHSRNYLLAGGTGAALAEHDDLADSEFLAVARLDGGQGREPAIRLAARIDAAELEAAFGDRIETRLRVGYDADRDRAYARKERRFGAILLGSTPAEPPAGTIPVALLEAAVARGIELPPAEAVNARALIDKVRFAARIDGEDYPDWSSENLVRILPGLVLPFLEEARSLNDLKRLEWLRIFEHALGPEKLRRLRSLYPDSFVTPAGISHRIDYSGETPSLAAPVQEFYGVKTHPTVGRARLPLKLELLSPARRPVQITTDLPGFWRGSWELVKKEMKGRYPKHFWPDNPAEALPTTRTRMKMELPGQLRNTGKNVSPEKKKPGTR